MHTSRITLLWSTANARKREPPFLCRLFFSFGSFILSMYWAVHSVYCSILFYSVVSLFSFVCSPMMLTRVNAQRMNQCMHRDWRSSVENSLSSHSCRRQACLLSIEQCKRKKIVRWDRQRQIRKISNCSFALKQNKRRFRFAFFFYFHWEIWWWKVA